MFAKTTISSLVLLTSVAGLVASSAQPSFAAASKARKCGGEYQALQNGECINTSFINPDRIPNPCAGGVCYRSGAVKHKKNKTQGN